MFTGGRGIESVSQSSAELPRFSPLLAAFFFACSCLSSKAYRSFAMKIRSSRSLRWSSTGTCTDSASFTSRDFLVRVYRCMWGCVTVWIWDGTHEQCYASRAMCAWCRHDPCLRIVDVEHRQADRVVVAPQCDCHTSRLQMSMVWYAHTSHPHNAHLSCSKQCTPNMQYTYTQIMYTCRWVADRSPVMADTRA